MILLTTSRRPTGRMRAFCRDLANSIPDVVRVNRGKMSQDGVAEKAIELEANRVILVDRWHGGPGKINLFQDFINWTKACSSANVAVWNSSSKRIRGRNETGSIFCDYRGA